ncbi:MAG TPA: LD-carboxypeptidase [Cyclobacteriaceae bacterium]|nr:LD-carboxypeptidase [Cyclobacteriaceae bacterium]HMV07836.1 LD-carboxypeptidase [Cyclobacteriaceae bacterium]HMV88104.1 LD-carboxypeptidase [Cyclobacteriaceae bacterium]HMW98970.1 LD-carboxypeptidase [Cyclobacteriaceae bacterium]HMX48396.1 LD-carboxypeptidase [Cyclobacteriaceae bacterium]
MIKPGFLRKGDKVCLVAPGRKLDRASIDTAAGILQEHGLSVRLGENLFSSAHSYLSGSDAERLADLQRALDDPSINAIICVRGGYGTNRILDQLDFTRFVKAPKWVCGFSDVTALHLKLQAVGIESIHGAMPVQFQKNGAGHSAESLIKTLFGTFEPLTAQFSAANRLGEGTGKLIGGNLSLLTDSLGTSNEIQTENKILVIEEVGEYAYRFDRMIVQLKRAGKLNKLAGLVIGHMTDIKEGELPFAETVEQMLRYHTREFNYPVAFNFLTGHDHPNLSWIEGADARLTATSTGSTLTF